MLVALSKHTGKSPDEVTTEELKEYLYDAIHRRGLSVSYIKQTISALKILYKDVLDKSWVDYVKIKMPRREYQIPEVLTKEEIQEMVEFTSNPKHKAIIALLYSSGMRRDELINLQIKDIDSKRMFIRVNLGKGNKSRDVLLSSKALELLRQYYKTHFPKPIKYVFEGGGKPGETYSASSITNIIKGAAKKVGIKKNVHIHTLRHSFATHMLEQGLAVREPT